MRGGWQSKPHILNGRRSLVDSKKLALRLETLESVDQSTFSFVGSLVYPHPMSALLSSFFNLGQPFFKAGGLLQIKRGREFCGASLLVESDDVDFPSVGLFGDRQSHSGADRFSGFGSLSVNVNFPPVDGLNRELSSFEEASSPEPFVQPHAGFILRILGVFWGYWHNQVAIKGVDDARGP